MGLRFGEPVKGARVMWSSDFGHRYYRLGWILTLDRRTEFDGKLLRVGNVVV